jgi:DUF971 family protein
VQPVFSDGHGSGIYSWSYLYMLGIEQDRLWSEYLQRLAEAGASRDAAEPGNAPSKRGAGPACGHH